MLKNSKGFTGIDIVISIIAILLFTSSILALMYNVKKENLEIEAKLLANIYLTETLENIGIAEYDDITSENTNIIPEMSDSFHITTNVTKISDEDATKEDIIKKVNITISYKVRNKTYEESVQRLKIK